MKNLRLTALLCIAFASAAQAASINEIFESIAKDAPTGNGDGHFVTTYKTKKFSRAKEIAKLKRKANEGNHGGPTDCKYGVYAGITSGTNAIKTTWEDGRTGSRLKGLAKKDLLRDIIYSEWDSSTGDSEYCSMGQFNVYGIDGSLLLLDYNTTD